MGNVKQLMVGCSMVASSPEKFKCPQVFRAVLGCMQGIPAQLADVQVIRLVKTEKDWKSASSRADGVTDCDFGKWHLRFFYDRDKKEVLRCVAYHEDLAKHPDPLNPEYTSVAIQYEPTMKALNAFINFPTLKILSTVEVGDWKFVAYVDKHAGCYRIVMTGPENGVENLEEVAKSSGNSGQFRSMLTNAFSAFGA